MLNIECTAANIPNPAIIALAAVYFDPDTGKEFDSLCTPVSLKSCEEHELLSTSVGMKWLEKEIPQTLKTSRESTTALPQALDMLSNFVQKCTEHNKSRLFGTRFDESPGLMIWGNGTMADNIWIRSAYQACSMEVPWKFYSDMCVRTFVKQVWVLTGKDFSFRPLAPLRRGLKHDPLSDCRFQIDYLVLARNELVPETSSQKLPDATAPGPSKGNPSIGYEEEEHILNERSKQHRPPHQAPQQLLTPETSLSGAPTQSEDDSSTVTVAANYLPMPQTSFSKVPESNETIPVPRLPLTPETSFSATPDLATDVPKVLATASRSLLTPQTSFTEAEFDASSVNRDNQPPDKRMRLSTSPDG